MTDFLWRRFPWRIAGWSAVAIALLIPRLANFPWTLSDYVFAAVVLGGAGLVLEGVARVSRDIAYRLGAFVAIGACVLLVWVSAAVGFLGDEDNPANGVFIAVLATVLVGAVVARLKPRGMSRTLLAAAAVQVLIGAAALAFRLGAPGFAGVYEAVMGTGLFATLWLVSAGLFGRAAANLRASPAEA